MQALPASPTHWGRRSGDRADEWGGVLGKVSPNADPETRIRVHQFIWERIPGRTRSGMEKFDGE